MKKLILIFILTFLTIFKIANAQWVEQNSGTTNSLFSVYCVNTDTVYVVGEYGTILKTTDGGTNWNPQISGITDTLNSVYCINADTVFAVGNNGTILKTINGGLNWDTITSGTINNLNSVFFVNADTGFVAGNNGTILKTINKGINWDTLNSGIIDNLNSVFFVNADTGYIVGNNGTIIITINEGINWDTLNSGTISNLNSVYFINSDTGYICCSISPSIIKTTDGGNNWVELYICFDGPLFSIHFPTSDTGYAVGWDLMLGGYILKNYGGLAGCEYWDLTISELNEYYEATFFINDTIGYVVGHNGLILKNTGIILEIYDKFHYKEDKIEIIPNPFNSSTILYLSLSFLKKNKSKIDFVIYDSLGRNVKYIEDIKNSQIKIKRDNLSSGIYFYQLKNSTEIIETGKLVIE